MQLTVPTLRKWYEEHMEEIVKDFLTFLRFKSISTDPEFKQETRQTALWLVEYLKKIGMDVQLWETKGQPCIFASYLKAGPDRPTVLIYHHYDVQPVDPLEFWESPPFDPVIKDNQVYARGAQDNKGQCFYSITALKAVLSLADKLNVNIKLLIEGEEETGSAGTAGVLSKKQKELKADYLLVVDSGLPKEGEPGICLGIRGIITMDVECKNSTVDLHSGSHGGIALNPNRALVSVLAQLWDESGTVAVPGFYDGIQMPAKDELEKYDTEFDVKEYQKSFGVKAFSNEGSYSYIESNWLRPTLEINGISGGYTGLGFKTVIPSLARAKISCRLVPGQDPKKIQKSISDFLKSHIAKGIELKIEHHQDAPAFRSSYDSEVAQTAAKAYEEIFQKPCKFILAGGSIPIVVDLVKVSNAEATIMGFGLAEDNIHAPNEHFGLDRFEMGFLTMGRMIAMFSEKQS